MFAAALTLSGLVTFIVALIVICIIVYAVRLVLDWIAPPSPVKQLVWLLVVVIALAGLLNQLGYIG